MHKFWEEKVSCKENKNINLKGKTTLLFSRGDLM